MKEFSHPSNGIRQSIDLKDLINTTVTVARNEWKYVADVEFDFSTELPPVPCLRDELGQVLVNLIVNAAQAISVKTHGGTTGKGRILIRTSQTDTYAEITISDDGCGIPISVQHRIFEPFFTTKPVGAGTGQGLAIAYSVVVDKHRGRIHFDSTEGTGTSFRILLPLEECSAPSTRKGGF
jgi:signal transduction histidine kinase